MKRTNQKPPSRGQSVYLVLLSEDYEGPHSVTVCRSKRAAEKIAAGLYTWVGPIPVGDGQFHKLY